MMEAWTLRKTVTSILFLYSLFLFSPAHAEDPPSTPPLRVQLFAPTQYFNPADGRADALRLEFKDVNLTDMGRILKRSRAVLPDFDAKHPPIIPFYISKLRTPAEQVEMIKAAEKQFNEAYPGVKPKIQIRYLEDEKVTVEALSHKLDEKIDLAFSQVPQTEETEREKSALHDANHRALMATLEAARKKEGIFQRPSLGRKIVNWLAGTKAAINLGSRGVQVAGAGYQGPGPLLAGISLLGGAPTLEYFGTKFETELNDVFSGHKLPYTSERPVLKALNRFYTSSKAAQFIKGATGNALLWGIADPAAMQFIGHFNNPGFIPPPSGADVWDMAKAAFPSAFLYMGGYLGGENLRQKGWIHEPVLDVGVRLTGLIWQVAEVILSTGRPEFKAALPWLLYPLWAGLGTVTAASFLLPARNNRIVLVDEALGNRADINALEALDSTKVVGKENSEIDAAVHEMQDPKEYKKLRWGAKEFVKKIFRGCGKAFGLI